MITLLTEKIEKVIKSVNQAFACKGSFKDLFDNIKVMRRKECSLAT